MNIAISFVAGFATCWWTAGWITRNVLRRPRSSGFARTIKGLGPDTFADLRKAVDAEASRRNSLL